MIVMIPPSYDSYDTTEVWLWLYHRAAVIVMIPPSYDSDDTTKLW